MGSSSVLLYLEIHRFTAGSYSALNHGLVTQISLHPCSFSHTSRTRHHRCNHPITTNLNTDRLPSNCPTIRAVCLETGRVERLTPCLYISGSQWSLGLNESAHSHSNKGRRLLLPQPLVKWALILFYQPVHKVPFVTVRVLQCSTCSQPAHS